MKFFKKVGYSITKLEKYPEMSAEGFKSALVYLVIWMIILALITSAGAVYQSYQSIQELASYIEKELPDFSYKDGEIKTESQEKYVLENKELISGKIIIDINQTSEDVINSYKEELKKSENGGVILLKNKAISENFYSEGETEQSYSDLIKNYGIEEVLGTEGFSKNDIIQYITGSQMLSSYFGMILTYAVPYFVTYMLESVIVLLLISIVGFLATMILKIKTRYIAILNMAVYSLTLSIILNIIYVIVNIFTEFRMEYFVVMYMGVAIIYLIAAIFLMRIELAKQKQELEEVEKVHEEVKEELAEKNDTKEEKGKKKNETENETQEDKQEKNDEGEPEGSNV